LMENGADIEDAQKRRYELVVKISEEVKTLAVKAHSALSHFESRLKAISRKSVQSEAALKKLELLRWRLRRLEKKAEKLSGFIVFESR